MVVFEFLQGQDLAALAHLRGGVAILKNAAVGMEADQMSRQMSTLGLTS